MARKYEMDMTTGALLPKIIRFSIPLMLSSLLQLLYNAADVVVVGRFVGDTALAAVGSTGSLIALITNVFMGLSIGTGVLVAQYFGAGDDEHMEQVVHTSIAVGLLGGAFLTVVGIVLARPILQVMGSPEDVIDQAELYIRIFFGGMIANLTYNFGAAVLRSVGDTQRPLYILAVTGLVNVGLNLLLVIVFRLGVAGVAIATIVSQILSCIAVLVLLMRAKGSIHFEWRQLRIHMPTLGRMLRVGLPAGLQGTIFSISNVIIQSGVNSFGSVVVAGSAAAANLEGFVYVAMNALYQTALTFAGQNVGAGKFDRIRRILACCVCSVAVVGVVLGALAYFNGGTLLQLYTTSPEVIAAGLQRMLYVCLPYFLCGIMDVMVGMLRGLGCSIVPMCVSIAGVCGVRIVWIYTIFRAVHTPEALYISYPISWTITAVIHIVCFAVIYRRMRRQHAQAVGLAA